ncbi:Unknown protein [Striga hermonthica]|uniref:RING-type E3 ubiquitin transferase n=1 Tax=Striga hermonthica TaxID=68872 RepID=A0A9N7R6R7_STRHE|nr:Unknown protein [Striga hermonthica]
MSAGGGLGTDGGVPNAAGRGVLTAANGNGAAGSEASLTNLSGPIEPTGSQLMGMADTSFSSNGRLEPDDALLPGAILVSMPRTHTRHVLTEADFAGLNVSAILSLGSRLQRRRYEGLQEDKISKYLNIITNNNIVDEKTVCAICLDDFCGKDMQVAIVDGCGHKFHACCLKKWLRRKNICPLCRRIAISVREDFLYFV